MRANKEYQVCKSIATYLRYQYPNVIFHFDLTGLSLTKAQAGMNKAIQHGKGYPDLFIAEKRNGYGGLFIEIKAEGIKIFNKSGCLSSPHLNEQNNMLNQLHQKGYRVSFAIGFDEAKKLIDDYLKS